MKTEELDFIKTIFQVLGFTATSTAALFAYISLKANHNWNRKQFASQILEKWNSFSLNHRKAIEKRFPAIYDINKNNESVPEITKADALKIYLASPNTEDWDLKFHLHEFLNFLEYIAVAKQKNIADQEIIDSSFKLILLKWYHVLLPFILVVKDKWGFNPWQPYVDLCNEYLKEENTSTLQKTQDTSAIWQYIRQIFINSSK